MNPQPPETDDPVRVSDPDVDPVTGDGEQESWEPPSLALGCPGQLVAAVLLAFVAGVILVGAVAVLSWLLRFR